MRIHDMTPRREIPAGASARLRLMATSDLHMHLTGYDYYADRADVSVGLTRTARLIRSARNEAAGSGALTLLFDNGDALQGTPFDGMAAGNPTRMHPMMQSFRHLHYDAIGLGNHDFNFGLDPLLRILKQAPCPVVCSNLRRLDGIDLPEIAPYALLDRTVRVGAREYPIRIGVLAFLPPQTVRWDSHLLQGRVIVDDIIGSARKNIDLVQRHACDVIVALAHSGLDESAAHDGMENAVLPLAALDGIDAVIAGHTHLRLPGTDHAGLQDVDAGTGAVHGKPVVMPGSAGSHLGLIDVELGAEPAKRWRVGHFDCALRPILERAGDGGLKRATREDPALSDRLAPVHAEIRTYLRRPVGHSDHALHSYFSFFAPDRAMAVVAAAQAAALRPLLAGTHAARYPVLSATSPCKFGGRSGPGHYTDVPAGKVLMRHIVDLYVFPNQLQALIISGRQIVQWLEKSAGVFRRITRGSTGTPLIDQSVPGHDFDVLHGLTWQIDLCATGGMRADRSATDTAGGRVSNVRLDGAPISPDQPFVVALNNYRVNGGGSFTCLDGAQDLPVPRLEIRDILRDYLSGALPADRLETALPAWRFKPMPDTSALVQTGPGAVAYLDELSDRGITVDGRTPEGFLRLTVPL